MTAQTQEITSRMQSLPTRSDEDVRKWEWKHEIIPALIAGGYDSRFLQEHTAFPHDGQKKAFEAASNGITAEGAIIALVGPRGTGKTTISAQVAIRLAWAWQEYYAMDPAERPEKRPVGFAKYTKLISLSNTLKPLYSDFGTNATESLQHYMEVVTNCGLLVIDEKHECEDLKTAQRILTDVLDRRYAKRKDSIIISNETTAKFQKSTSDSVLSRLKEHGQIIACEWESFR